MKNSQVESVPIAEANTGNETTYLNFLALKNVQSASVNEQTLKMWHHIYVWVEKHGYADTADSPEFVRYVQDWRNIKCSTIAAHLGKMAEAGLLTRHKLKRKLSNDVREELLNPVLGIFSGTGLPTALVRYSLPGMDCSLEFKAAARKAEIIANTWTVAQ